MSWSFQTFTAAQLLFTNGSKSSPLPRWYWSALLLQRWASSNPQYKMRLQKGHFYATARCATTILIFTIWITHLLHIELLIVASWSTPDPDQANQDHPQHAQWVSFVCRFLLHGAEQHEVLAVDEWHNTGSGPCHDIFLHPRSIKDTCVHCS